MDNTRILPPLVRGKVTGVLDFFIDEIRLFRNILLVTDNFDLVLQIQWWGEVLPAYVRPKKVQIQERNYEGTHLLECFYHSAKYKIKTTLDLFKSYLKTCEVVELSVLEAVENFVIGSAFLRDLISLLKKNNELITLPVFDSLGERIGDVIIHIRLSEVTEEESKQTYPKMTQPCKNNSVIKKPNKDVNTPYTVQSDFLGEKSIVYDGDSNKNVPKERVLEVGSPYDKFIFKIRKKGNSNPNQSVTEIDSLFKKQETNININLSGEESSGKSFPEIRTSSDSSRILYFGVGSKQSGEKASFKNPNIKLANKFNSNSIKFKSRLKTAEDLANDSSEKNSFSRNTNIKKVDSFKTLAKSAITEKDEQFDSTKPHHTSPIQQTKDSQHKTWSPSSRSESASTKQTDLCSIPLKESSNVLDYLLGSDMSKADEETALNDFKHMSPSQNLVDSINQLCLVSSIEIQNPQNRSSISAPKPVKQPHLNFDFAHPIERSYYETFFLKSNSTAAFEIAEALNQPEYPFTFDTTKKSQLKSESEGDIFKNYNTYPQTEEGPLEGECYLGSIVGPDRKKSCARCKYYKKLDELDVIIESLKHFEQKMISHEMQMQSSLKDHSNMTIKEELAEHLLESPFNKLRLKVMD